MINVQDFIENGKVFRKFKVDELLFAEINCPVEENEPVSPLWWHDHFFAYALAGEMVLKTLHSEYVFKAGDCIFAKKGSLLSTHHRIREDFCEIRVFVPDSFIKTVFHKYRISATPSDSVKNSDSIIPVKEDEVLHAYFHSLFPYFAKAAPPVKSLLKLKFEELLVNILSNHNHWSLNCFLSEICRSTRPHIPEIMEANFVKNLELKDFARLCGRGLSAFKVEFKKIYGTSPGKWLLKKRLEYGRYLLETTNEHVAEICYMCGFENNSHFGRVFKENYGLPPRQFQAEFHKASSIKKNIKLIR